MARRLPSHKKRKYTILWGKYLAGHVVSREVFNRALASQWIIAEPSTMDENGNMIPSTSARVAHGVKASLHAGALCLEDMAHKAIIWIFTSWISIDRDSPRHQDDDFTRYIQCEYGNLKSKKVEPDGTWIERCDWEVSL
jgi:hypothetical protein